MKKVRILIVEDEVIIAESLKQMLEKMGYECVGKAMRAQKALEMVTKLLPDLVLLDIHLKGGDNGIELAKEIKKVAQIPFLFMTSYGDQKTIEQATLTAPYGYLLKPVEQQNVHAAIETALNRFAQEKEQHLELTDKKVSLLSDAFFLKDEYQYVKISMASIDFIKSSGNYVEVYMDTGKKVFKDTLKNLESHLSKDTFFQTHRSYLVNMQKIESISGSHVVVNGVEVPIVKQRKDLLLQLFNTSS